MANSKMKSKIQNPKYKIVFMGTPEFGAIILEELIKGGCKPILVITAPDKPVGRKQILTPPPAKAIAQKYKISILQPEKIQDSKFKIQDSKPDLIVVAAYGQILPKEILDIPKRGSLNVHPSLLPKYRGASPIQYAILNGDKKTGVTIILMDEKIDRGPILNQRALEIEKDETSTTLHHKLANLGAGLLMETIPKWIREMIKPRPQDDTQATYTKILTRGDGEINWKKTAKDLERQIRAFDDWPGSFTFWQKRDGTMVKIKILKARVLESKGGITYPIGKTLVVPQNEICVQCGKGFLGKGGDFLVIEKLQLEGKKEIGSEEFLRGYPDFIGTIFK
jgi:methionyl-tRNA formyltransferase